jgi:hypothetical protein
VMVASLSFQMRFWKERQWLSEDQFVSFDPTLILVLII